MTIVGDPKIALDLTGGRRKTKGRWRQASVVENEGDDECESEEETMH